jgi:hypothetical protein
MKFIIHSLFLQIYLGLSLILLGFISRSYEFFNSEDKLFEYLGSFYFSGGILILLSINTLIYVHIFKKKQPGQIGVTDHVDIVSDSQVDTVKGKEVRPQKTDFPSE